MNHSREEEHQFFLDWLIIQIQQHEVDALIVAGDIFDTGTPPSYARHLYYNFLKELSSQCKVQVVIIGGNHDSISTLNESGTLLKLLNIHVIGGKQTAEDETFILKQKNGDDGAVICAVPFLRDRDVRLSREGENFDSKREALRLGIRQHYLDTLSVAQELNKDKQLPILATGHLTTSGGQLTDGVREIYIGSLESYDSADFPDEFDYIALGHLHAKQAFGKRQHIRYCGSPIPISFSEAQTQKIINLVEVEKGHAPHVKEIEIPLSRHLESISGSLEDIQRKITELPITNKLTSWIEIVINNDIEISAAQSLIKESCKDLPLEILRFRRARVKKKNSKLSHQKEVTLKELTVEEVFHKKISRTELEKEVATEMTTAFKEIYNDVLSEKNL
jgi:exonuclease SbcD